MKSIYTAAMALVALSAWGQEFRATLQGSISDPTQAGVPGASVMLKNLDTGIQRDSTADSSGHYVFPFVAPGSYSLTVQAAGFKTTVRDGIQVSVNDNLRVDVAMPLGQASDTVQVTGEVTAVQAESSSLGSVISEKIIDSQPLKGHSSLFLYMAAAGVVGNRYLEDTRPTDTGTNVLFTANGSPPATGEVSVDGVSNTVNVGRGLYLSPWVPATGAVGEIKMLMGTLPAEYGRAAGMFTNVVIKSGTNDLHGAFYEYLRNSAVDANLFFQRGLGQKLTPYNANLFGLNIGGPIRIPGLYNGRNRTFFFFSYEGAREGNGQGPSLSVPTPKMRQGNFSEFSGAIYDPFSVHGVNGVPTRDPIPGNIVPAALQDPVAQKIMNYWPAPNNPNVNPATPWVNNYVQSSKWPTRNNVWITKFDHKLTDKHQLFVRTNTGTGFFNFNYDFPGIATPGRNVVHRPNKGIAVDDTWLISPRTVLDTRAGLAYGKEQQQPFSANFDLASLGFPQSFIGTTQFQNFPTIAVTGFEGLVGGVGWKEQPGYNYSLQSSLSMQRGRHLYKTGVQFNLLRGNFLTSNNPSGTFSFNQAQTGGPRADTPAAGSGLAMASMLLGYPSGGSIDTATGVSIQNFYSALYFQDDFRVTSKLTLNLGLRWDYQSPVTERYNRTTRGFAYNTPSPLQVPGLKLTGGLLYAGVNGAPRGLYESDWRQFAPRIGVAYSLNSKTVLRTGYSLTYIPLVGAVYATGYSNTTSMVTTQDGITPKDLLRNPFPNGQLPPIGNSQGLATLIGQNISFVEPADRTPQFHNWHFDVQREIAPRTALTASYVGSRAYHLSAAPTDFTTAINENVNQLDPRYLAMGTALLTPVANPFFGVIPTGSLAGQTVQQTQLLRPYPQFTGVTRMAPAFGNSHYHAAQIQLEKRTSHGVTALVSYTIAKNLGDMTNAGNAYNRQAERAYAQFDVPQRLTVTATWELPVGQKRRFGGNMPRALDLLAGGWALSTFQSYQGGFPLAFSLSRATAGAGSSRPNAAGNPADGVTGSIGDRLRKYFNTAAFAQPADFTYGNVSPYIGSVRSPGMNNVDATLSKTFRVTERARAEFRASMFNVLNHPVFGAPGTGLGNANFGVISSQANLNRQWEFAVKILY
ncbi:MAG TPA: TonB-dependent receptor [Bryobacteraceae bacterium]|nr:TonB-dependent receptor [Bryobacteraceae bacterium]